jgi:hypothetical protein
MHGNLRELKRITRERERERQRERERERERMHTTFHNILILLLLF